VKQDKEGELEIDLLQLVRVIWKNAILIVLVGAFCAVAVYAYTKICIAPTYKADIMVNVNNNANQTENKDSVSTSEISASKSLVSTYIVILKSRSMLNEVKSKANLKYSYEKLYKMVAGASVSSTEILQVEVTAYSPEEAELIANTIAEVLPEKISTIIPGSSAVIVDYAVAPEHASGPHKTRNAALGFLVGAFLTSVVVVIMDMLDDTVRDETFITSNFDIPLLASIPDLSQASENGYYSYYQSAGARAKSHSTGSAQTKKEGGRS